MLYQAPQCHHNHDNVCKLLVLRVVPARILARTKSLGRLSGPANGEEEFMLLVSNLRLQSFRGVVPMP